MRLSLPCPMRRWRRLLPLLVLLLLPASAAAIAPAVDIIGFSPSPRGAAWRRLEWSSAAGAAAYAVYHAGHPFSPQQVQSADRLTTTATVIDLPVSLAAAGPRWFRVAAIDGAGAEGPPGDRLPFDPRPRLLWSDGARIYSSALTDLMLGRTNLVAGAARDFRVSADGARLASRRTVAPGNDLLLQGDPLFEDTPRPIAAPEPTATFSDFSFLPHNAGFLYAYGGFAPNRIVSLGADRRLLVTTPGRIVPSPDGQMAAVFDGPALTVRPVASTSPTLAWQLPLAPSDALHAESFAPDNARLAYVRYSTSGPQDASLHLLPLREGSIPVRVSPTNSGANPRSFAGAVWVGPGRLLFACEFGGPQELYLWTEGQEARLITPAFSPGSAGVELFTPTPDGNSVVYIADHFSGKREAWLAPLDGTRQTRQLHPLFPDDRDVSAFWIVDGGRKILLSLDRDAPGRRELWLSTIEAPIELTRLSAPLLPGERSIDQVVLSPDAALVAYYATLEAGGGGANLYVAPAAGGWPAVTVARDVPIFLDSTPAAAFTPGALPPPPVPPSEQIRMHLLGLTGDTRGMDLSADGRIDTADLVRAVNIETSPTTKLAPHP